MASMDYLYNTLVETNHLRYLLGYKMSQDHLESWFGAVRAHLGAKTNPNVKEFGFIFRKLSMRLEVTTASTQTTARSSPSFFPFFSPASLSKKPLALAQPAYSAVVIQATRCTARPPRWPSPPEPQKQTFQLHGARSLTDHFPSFRFT